MYLGIELLIVAAICSTIDRLFWGGSLDYILIANYIIDLKDIYLTIGGILLVWGEIIVYCEKNKGKLEIR